MKKTVKTTNTIDASPEKVWNNISKASGVHDWLPLITSCRLEGDNRICSTAQGDLKETILKIDDENKVFQYSIDEQQLLPIQNAVGTMTVQADNKKTTLLWDLSFDIEDENNLGMVTEVVEGMYQAGANGLETISQ